MMEKKNNSSVRFTRFVIFLIVVSFLVPGTPLLAQKKKKRRKRKEEVTVSENIILTKEDKISPYRIVIPSAPTEYEVKASKVLQDYLLQISGTALPIIAANKSKSDYEIVLGQNERLDDLRLGINLNDLKQDGFLIKTDNKRLVIAGGNKKGTLNGVYTFLEKYLGCRMYSPRVKVIPEQERIELGEINDLQVPVIEYRTLSYKVSWDAEYVDWHKLSHDGNGRRPDWGLWVHTFHRLVPPDVYFKEHPEYYSEVNGERLPTQLCLTNPDVLQITIQNLRKEIARKPEALYWSVSQNDNRNYCQCAKCRAIDEREGSPSGTIIEFVNKVADQFPEKVISTLAYEYGRHAPKTLHPRENVNIMLCSIEVPRDEPIDQDSSSVDFMLDVEDWGKISDDIIVWDYVIQFPNLISPFPNLHVLQPNLQFFARNGVTAMFEQGNREVGGEFAELRTYMISKLMWDPDLDVEALMNDFLKGYYGNAWQPIRQYIDDMTSAMLESGEPLRIFGSPVQASTSYLTPELLDSYEALFDEAELLAKDSAELLERIRVARLPVSYAVLEQAKYEYTGERGVFQNINGNWEVKSEIRSMLDPFTDLLIREGVTRVKEWCTPPEEYRSSTYRLFSLGMKEHLAYGKNVSFISPDTSEIRDKTGVMLTDGKRGCSDYGYNWFSCAGNDLEVIIDLEEIQQVRRIESAYYQFAAWLRLFPVKVEYFLSEDGVNFSPVGDIDNILPITQYGGIHRDFIADFEPQPARYIKVKAHTFGNTPEWHPGSGRPASILVDEIVVE
ncbi:DUF4838 domain-containing protein [Bacteroidota bacterium]